MQVKRAVEPGHGRSADTPTQIPARGWKDILWRTYEEISADRLLMIAAGVVFYAMLAVVPAITALVSLYGLFAKASTINEHLSFIGSVMPGTRLRADQRSDHPHRRQQRRQAHRRIRRSRSAWRCGARTPA